MAKEHPPGTDKAPPPIGALQAALEGMKEFGGMMKEMGGKVWDGLTPVVEHGSHELSAAIFNGSAFVMYPRNQEAQSLEGPGLEQAKDGQEQERDRGGRAL